MNAPGDILYLDHAATAPLAPGVLEAITQALDSANANPASVHPAGRAAAAEVEAAARALAALIGAAPGDLVWTSGATESINLALKGTVEFAGRAATPHVVSVVSEHHATLDTLDRLEARGARVTCLGVDATGRIELDALDAALADGATLVSVMHVNNETGVIQDIGAVGARCAQYGVTLHVDAAQSLGRLAIDVDAMGIDLLSMSAHKIGGPKGIGALYVRPRTGLAAQIHGGGQQRGLRSGTLATHQIAGFGAAAAQVAATRDHEQVRLAGLREALWARIGALPEVYRNGGPDGVAAPFLNVGARGVHGRALLTGLMEGRPGLAVAAGAACGAAKHPASHVLRAMGRSPREAAASLRFSLGADTDAAMIEIAADRVIAEVERLRRLAPAVA